MKNLFYLFLVVCFISCKNDNKEAKSSEAVNNEEKFEMYEMSEMAALMEQMYVDNQRIKDKIINGDSIGKFPQHFLKIHESVMTDEKDKDAFFDEQAKKFIEAQELIYNDPTNAKKHFNDGVDACISCHQQKCSGPIPRIKKLYIE